MATPSPPTNVSITRVSTTRVRVTWSGIRGMIQLLRRATPGSGTAAWEEHGLWTGPVDSGKELTVGTGYEYRARVRSVDLWDPSDMSGSVWSSDLARCFDKPSTPASVVLTRTSDKSWPIAITHAAVDATKPVAETVVERWLESTGDWVVTCTLSGRAESTSYAYDIPDNRLRVRVATRNAAGTSGWVYSSTLSSTPAKATGVTGARSGATGIVVKGTIQARYATTIDVLAASSPDGITWTAPAAVSGHTGITTPGAGQVLQRTITTLDPNLRWRFTYRTNVAGGLSAVSDPSVAVLVLQPPAAPTQTGPDRVQDAYKRIDLTWRHEPVDGSEQTAAEVRWRVDGGAWTTVAVTTATKVELHYPTLGEPGTLEWDVRTKGAHNDFGARSGIASVPVALPPESPITSPAEGAVLSGNRLTLSVGWADAQGAAMVAWTRRLYRGAELIEERSGAAPTASTASTTFATLLDNNTGYRAEWSARSGTGLESVVASVEVTTSFTPPFVPEAFGVVWVEDEALARVAAAAGGLSTAWAGTAGRSVSIESRDGIETRRNLATNPKLTDTYGTLAIPDIRTNRAVNPRADATWVQNYGTGGAGVTSLVGGMRRMEWTTAPTGGNPRIRAGGSIPVTPGETITISADMASSRRARIALDFNLAGAWVSSASGPWTAVSTDPASPTRLTYTQVVPAGVDAAIIFVGAEYTVSPANLPAAGDWFAAGRLRVGEDGGYFDGNSISPDPAQVYGWAGAPGASPSWQRWTSAASGSAPRPRVNGGADISMLTTAGTYAWVDGDGLRIWSPAGSVNASVAVAGSAGDASGTAMSRLGLTKGRSYAVAALISQDEPLGTDGSADCRRGIRIYTRGAGGVITNQYADVALDEAQTDTRLAAAWTIPANAEDCSILLQSSALTGDRSVRWRRLIICEGNTEAEALAKVRSWFDGDSLGARTSSVASRIERSDDDGQTWTTVVKAPSPVASADDVRAPLNRTPWYRVVAVSALGVEATTEPVQVATPCGDVWLEGEDGRRARIRTNLRLAKGWAQEAVAPVYYGQAYGESHYGDGRTDDVTVTGTLIAGEGLEQDLASLLRGQDVYYRDPRGAAWWAQLAGRFTDDSDWIERTEISVPLTRVLGGDDES